MVGIGGEVEFFDQHSLSKLIEGLLRVRLRIGTKSQRVYGSCSSERPSTLCNPRLH